MQDGGRDSLANNMGDLSITTPFKDAIAPPKLPQQRIYEEVKICNLPESNNEVYKCRRPEGPGAQTYHREWAQVFDVADGTSLVTRVDGRILTLNLLHKDKQALHKWCRFNGNDAMQMVSEKEADMLFEEYSSARLQLDGNIVPNIHFLK